MKKAVFIDKDGTLIENVPYNADPDKIKFYPGIPEALYKLKQRGYLLVVVSNQPGIPLGYFKEQQLEDINTEIINKLKPFGIEIEAFYYCMHHPDGSIPEYTKNCDCRKPKPGLILKAKKELNIDVKKSWIIGDILNDVEAGKRVGCRSVLIDNGNETEWITNKWRNPEFKVASFEKAADVILRNSF